MEIGAILGILVILIMLAVAGDFIRKAIQEARDNKKRLAEAKKRATTLRSGETVPLTSEPYPSAIRIRRVDPEDQLVQGVVVVTLPADATEIRIENQGGWERFTVHFKQGKRVLSPTWYMGWHSQVRLATFGKFILITSRPARQKFEV